MKKLNKKQMSAIAVTAVVAVACVTTVSVKSVQKKNMTASLNGNINAEVKNEVENVVVEAPTEEAIVASTPSTTKASGKAPQSNTASQPKDDKLDSVQAVTENATAKNYKEDLSEETIKSIKKDFALYKLGPLGLFEDKSYDKVSFSYGGTYDGYIVGIMYHKDFKDACEWVQMQDVGKYSLPADLYAWKNSKIYTMSELYNSKALSEEAWEAIDAEY